MTREELPAILGGRPVRPAGPPDWPRPEPAVEAALAKAYVSGDWGRYHGPHVERLREFLAAYHRASNPLTSDTQTTPHVHLCASGTAAVEFALRGVGVGPGDEVVIAAYEFKANVQNLFALGVVPVLVDVRPDNWNLDVSRIEEALSEKTKAILVTHLHGGVVDVPAVMEIARSRGLAVVEDACQMPGAIIAGRRAGTWGDAGVLSFGGSKLTTAGRGGAVITSRDDVAQRIRVHTQRGNDVSPLSELQAAVLLPQWEALDERNSQRARNVAVLRRLLHPARGLVPFAETEGCQSGYYKLGFQYDPGCFHRLTRDQFSAAIRAEGIALDPGFRGLHKTHASRRYRTVSPLAVADAADAGILTLHHPVLLGSDADLAEIVAAIEKIRRSADRLAARPVCH